MIRNYILAAALVLSGMTAMSQTVKDEIAADHRLAGAGCLVYPTPTEKLTPAPKGKKAFYISHYGRHGSRFLGEKENYSKPLETLDKAKAAGALSAKGLEVLDELRMMAADAELRWGDLTPLGAEQHRQIARRMYKNFPEVFRGDVSIEAKSSTYVRSILSMENELQELKALNPKLRISHDGSNHDMYYLLGNCYQQRYAAKGAGKARGYVQEWASKNIDYNQIMKRLFGDEQYMQNNVNTAQLCNELFLLASIQQGSELRDKFDLFDTFTADEIYNLWLQDNMNSFVTFGNSTFGDDYDPLDHYALVDKIVEDADSCLKIDRPGASLRFGHDVVLARVVCQMNIDGYGNKMHPSDVLKNKWLNFNIYPMACNLQFVFYRKNLQDTDVWVKVLLNEHEATLPIAPVEGCYYRWADIRKFYTGK